MATTDEFPDFLGIPRHIREKIYRLVFGSGPKHRSEYIDRMGPHVPIKDLGLLRVSRMVYKEAIAVLYELVDLGADPELALNYVQFVLPKHGKRIQSVTIYNFCQGCRKSFTGSIYAPCNWHPVLKVLAATAAPISRVNIAFDACEYGRSYNGRPLDTCHLKWDPDHALFWDQLTALSFTDQICFIDVCPEYFVIRLARNLGWDMKGARSSGGYGCPISRFKGSLVNPEPAAYRVLKLDMVRCRTNDPLWVVTVCPLLRLPVEIRHWIYKYAMKWEYRAFWPIAPATFNQGIGLLSSCRQIANEAKPFLYHSLTIHGGSPLRDLETFKSNIVFTRRFNIQFSCFCAWDGGLEHRNHTLFDEWTREISQPGHALSVHQTIQDQWTEALKRIQSLEANVDVGVMFQSCCRNDKPIIGDTSNNISACIYLENHFIDDLLATCHHSNVQQIALWGNVPPSFAMRLLTPSSRFDQRAAPLYLHAISKAMRNYIGRVEDEWDTWISKKMAREPPPVTWRHRIPFPNIVQYPIESSFAPHFVFVKKGTAQDLWVQNVMPQGEGYGPLMMRNTQGELNRHRLELWRDYLDHGVISSRVAIFR